MANFRAVAEQQAEREMPNDPQRTTLDAADEGDNNGPFRSHRLAYDCCWDSSCGMSETDWYAWQYFPGMLSRDKPVPRYLGEIAQALDRYVPHGSVTKKHQVLPFSATQPGVFEWKRRVIDTMADRARQFEQFPFPGPDPLQTTSICQSAGRTPDLPHELLLMAFKDLAPADLLAASFVNKAWCGAVDKTLESIFRQMPTFAPVHYGQVIDWSIADQMASLHPTEFELECISQEILEMELRYLMGENTIEGFSRYFPARFTQAKHRLDRAQEALHGAYHRMGPSHNILHEPRLWLDFSQIEINPYFAALFGDRLQNHNGAISISLQNKVPHCRSLFAPPEIVPTPILDKLRTTHITSPPSRSIGIYIWSADRCALLLVQRIHCDTGIHFGTLLNALLTHTPELRRTWKQNLEQMKFYVDSSHGSHFQGHNKLSCWDVEPSPTFYLLLDNGNSSKFEVSGHYTREDYTHAINRSIYIGFFKEWKRQLGGDLNALLEPVMFPFNETSPFVGDKF